MAGQHNRTRGKEKSNTADRNDEGSQTESDRYTDDAERAIDGSLARAFRQEPRRGTDGNRPLSRSAY